jgi:hypothetical protein
LKKKLKPKKRVGSDSKQNQSNRDNSLNILGAVPFKEDLDPKANQENILDKLKL